MLIEICPETEQLVFEIRRGPEQRAIQILASNRAVLLRFPLCGAEVIAAYQALVPLGISTT
jgi:hypothetical protein